MRLVCGMCDFSQLMPMTGDIEGSGHCASDLASTITTLRNLNAFVFLKIIVQLAPSTPQIAMTSCFELFLRPNCLRVRSSLYFDLSKGIDRCWIIHLYTPTKGSSKSIWRSLFNLLADVVAGPDVPITIGVQLLRVHGIPAQSRTRTLQLEDTLQVKNSV